MVRHPADQEAGFSTTDGCWLFEIEGDVRSVAPYADNNVYLSIPHPPATLSWPPTRFGVLEFLRTTFFDNVMFGLQLAAIYLTLRAVSIVRAFITVGPGGVGQSLNTCLIANLFGGSMSVFYSEDELRKQADTFTGKVNIRGVTYSPPRTCKLSFFLFFFGRFGPTCEEHTWPGRHHRPGGRQHRPGGRPSPVRHLDEDGHIFGLDKVRDERDSQVPRGDGNDGALFTVVLSQLSNLLAKNRKVR